MPRCGKEGCAPFPASGGGTLSRDALPATSRPTGRAHGDGPRRLDRLLVDRRRALVLLRLRLHDGHDGGHGGVRGDHPGERRPARAPVHAPARRDGHGLPVVVHGLDHRLPRRGRGARPGVEASHDFAAREDAGPRGGVRRRLHRHPRHPGAFAARDPVRGGRRLRGGGPRGGAPPRRRCRGRGRHPRRGAGAGRHRPGARHHLGPHRRQGQPVRHGHRPGPQPLAAHRGEGHRREGRGQATPRRRRLRGLTQRDGRPADGLRDAAPRGDHIPRRDAAQQGAAAPDRGDPRAGDSTWVGRPVADLGLVARRILLLAVREPGAAGGRFSYSPPEDSIVAGGSVLILLGQPADLATLGEEGTPG